MVLWSYACKFIVMNVSPEFWKCKGCWTYDCFHIYPKITYHFNSGLEVLNIVPAFWQWKDNHLFQLRRLQTLKQVIYKKLKKLHTAVEKSVQRNIFIWSYFVPPWCYITKTRLLKLKQHELSVFFNMRNHTSRKKTFSLDFLDLGTFWNTWKWSVLCGTGKDQIADQVVYTLLYYSLTTYFLCINILSIKIWMSYEL